MPLGVRTKKVPFKSGVTPLLVMVAIAYASNRVSSFVENLSLKT